ncbi:MAG: hypothetical protein AAF183_18025 [Pseudomonadota bacterium]
MTLPRPTSDERAMVEAMTADLSAILKARKGADWMILNRIEDAKAAILKGDYGTAREQLLRAVGAMNTYPKWREGTPTEMLDRSVDPEAPMVGACPSSTPPARLASGAL